LNSTNPASPPAISLHVPTSPQIRHAAQQAFHTRTTCPAALRNWTVRAAEPMSQIYDIRGCVDTARRGSSLGEMRSGMGEEWESRLLGAVRLCDVRATIVGRDVEAFYVRSSRHTLCHLDRTAHVGTRSGGGIGYMRD
jgi:hypothetical protein